MHELWIGIIIIALYVWAETYHCIKANRHSKQLAEMKQQKVLGSKERHIDIKL